MFTSSFRSSSIKKVSSANSELSRSIAELINKYNNSKLNKKILQGLANADERDYDEAVLLI